MKQGSFRSRKTSHSIQIGEEIRVGEWRLQDSWELWRSVEWLIGICKSWEVLQTPQSNVLRCLAEIWSSGNCQYVHIVEFLCFMLVEDDLLLNIWTFLSWLSIIDRHERLFYVKLYLGPADIPVLIQCCIDFDFGIWRHKLTTLGESMLKKVTSGTCYMCVLADLEENAMRG